MSWLDSLHRVTLPDGRRLIGASFRGVPFFVNSSDRSGGRRVVVHEFPLRDDPDVEDLGRRARPIAVEGYLIGDDYVARRDELLSALEDVSGPGELVHPYYGVRRAICTDLVARETRRDGRMVVLQLAFIEAPTRSLAPVAQPDHADLVSEGSDTVVHAAGDALLEDYDVADQPSFAVESLQDEFVATLESIRDELAPVAQTAQEAAKLSHEILIAAQQAAALVREPVEMVAVVVDSLESIRDSALVAPGLVLSALLEAHGRVGSIIADAIGASSTRQRERANQAGLRAMLRRVLVAEAARLAPMVAYETLEDAHADSQAIADLLEEQAADAGATAYPALVMLRARVLRAVPGDTVLARLVDIERRVPIPSLVLTYQLYGSVAKELDVVARNRVRHPGFVTGSIQVLSG